MFDVGLNLVDTFYFLGSNTSSTEKDVNKRIGNAGSALDGLNVICKSDLPDDLKRYVFRAIAESLLLYGHLRLYIYKNGACRTDQLVEITPKQISVCISQIYIYIYISGYQRETN